MNLRKEMDEPRKARSKAEYFFLGKCVLKNMLLLLRRGGVVDHLLALRLHFLEGVTLLAEGYFATI